jgi:alpha-amylase
VTANIQQYTTDLGSYHGYWQQNIYELNTHFGTDEDLQALSKALHDRGMYIMVDVVTNDLAWAGNHSSVDYSQLIPFNNVSYYHSYCPVNDSDSQTDVRYPARDLDEAGLTL